MPSSTRSNKENQLIFSSDPASLERSIRKGIRSSSIDNNTSSSLDSRQPPSTQTPVSSTDTRSPPSTEDTLPDIPLISLIISHASCSKSHAHFTEEWSVCLAKGSCRGDKRLSIDVAPLPSIDGDARIWAEHIL
ncbi:hypothetical protein DY000_02020905 [Brassica cretica]|uniref:Uncharacterized protein n=1 Tax=Brassica cretica TaxID=69181 RepID=A0ABQ7ELZ2_BRACR|nr:hypothetical protein DY000_02020905 [Brassica cretica]